MLEKLYSFFDIVNNNIELVLSILGFLGISLFNKLKWKKISIKGKITLCIFIFFPIIMCIYCNNLVVIPDIENEPYLIAKQMLLYRDIDLSIINESEYEQIPKEYLAVCLVDREVGEHIRKGEKILLRLVDRQKYNSNYTGQIKQADTLFDYIYLSSEQIFDYAAKNAENYRKINDNSVIFTLSIGSVLGDCFVENNDNVLYMKWLKQYFEIDTQANVNTYYEKGKQDFDLIYASLCGKYGSPQYVDDKKEISLYSWSIDSNKELRLIYTKNRFAEICIEISIEK